jgi:hypothetical protein
MDVKVFSRAMILPTSPGSVFWCLLRVLVFLILVSVPAKGHSWIEEAAVVDEHGRRIGPTGYARDNGKATTRVLRLNFNRIRSVPHSRCQC